MANTRQLRTQMKSLKSLQKILKALEIVSTIKLQKKTENLRDFFIDFLNVLHALEDTVNVFDFDKRRRDEQGRRLIVLISSDK